MNIASPWLAVAGAASMAVPILIHLFLRRRRVPHAWAAMELLRRAIQQSQRTRRIERWLLLLLRCLILLLVGLAIARIGTSSTTLGGSPVVLAVILDDGAASWCTTADGTMAFEASRRACVDEIQRLPAGSMVHVMTTTGSFQRSTDSTWPERAIEILKTLSPTYEPSRARDAVDHADRVLRAESLPGRIVLASSFSKGAVDPESGVLPPTKAALEIRNVGSVALGTRAIDSVTQRSLGPSAGGALVVDVVLSRPQDARERATIEVTVTDPVTNRTATTEAVFVEGSSTTTASASLPVDPGAGTHAIVATIQPDSQPADDTRVALMALASQADIVILDRERVDADEGSSALWLERALDPVPGIGLTSRRLDPAELRAGSLTDARSIVVCRPELLDAAGWAECTRACEAGSLVVIMPPTEDTFAAWQEPAAALLGPGITIRRDTIKHDPPRRLAAQQPRSPLTQLIVAELPELTAPIEVTRQIVVDGPPTALTHVLDGEDGSLFAGVTHRKGGVVAILACAPVPSWSNLPTKPLFVPFIQELIRQSEVLLDAQTSLTIGLDRLPSTTTELRGVSAGATQDQVIRVGPDGTLPPGLVGPGIYQAISTQGGTALVALNVDESACNPEPNDPGRFAAWLSQTGTSEQASNGPALEATVSSFIPVLLLAFAGVLVLTETLLGRSFSTPEPG